MPAQNPSANNRSSLAESRTGEFSRLFSGSVILPGSGEYDSARRVWNGMIDRRPGIIARCGAVSDVVSAVRFARDNDLQLAVRGGGHNVSGNGVCDEGIVIDLSHMKGIRVDGNGREVYAQAGLTWGEFDRETQAYGLATPGGLISTTGIAGLTLGGGFGWLSRKYGLSCDNLLSADVVTADGEFLTASSTEHQDLYWGIRGGGGNFGIVTSFRFRLHPVSTVFGTIGFRPGDEARQTLEFYRDFTGSCPDEVSSFAAIATAPPAPFIPASWHGRKTSLIATCHCGSPEEAERISRPLRTFGHPFAVLGSPMPYVVIQSSNDPIAPPGMRNYWKSEFVGGLSDGLIDVLAGALDSASSPMNAVHIYHMQGAISRVSAESTAYSYRDAPLLVVIIASWTDRSEDAEQIRWARDLWERIRGYSLGGTYVNFLGDEGEDRVRSSYAESTHARLTSLKTRYDPSNLFRLNQNIPPGAQVKETI